MKLSLHKANPEEARELIDLYLQFFKSTGMEAIFCKPEQRYDLIAWIERYIDEHQVWIWRLNGSPVALVQIVPDKHELFAIVVNNKNRNSGIGRYAIGDLQNQYKILTTRPVTRAAKALFSGCGFQRLQCDDSVWEWKV